MTSLLVVRPPKKQLFILWLSLDKPIKKTPVVNCLPLPLTVTRRHTIFRTFTYNINPRILFSIVATSMTVAVNFEWLIFSDDRSPGDERDLGTRRDCSFA